MGAFVLEGSQQLATTDAPSGVRHYNADRTQHGESSSSHLSPTGRLHCSWCASIHFDGCLPDNKDIHIRFAGHYIVRKCVRVLEVRSSLRCRQCIVVSKVGKFAPSQQWAKGVPCCKHGGWGSVEQRA